MSQLLRLFYKPKTMTAAVSSGLNFSIAGNSGLAAGVL